MKRLLLCVVCALAQFVTGAAVGSQYSTSYKYLYGQKIVEYGDGRHPGVVFSVPRGTPVIAASGGVVEPIGHSVKYGGYYVGVSHGNYFTSWYVHLDEVHVKQGQSVKRGDLIGLSGADYRGWKYLHFRICQKGIFCNDFKYSVDPRQHWLGGKLQCFDRRTDYSTVAQTKMTVPLACGDYARELIARARQK